MNKDNSEYEIDRELTGKFAIEMNVEYQEKIEQLEEENKKLKEEREMLIEDLSSDKELQQQIAQKQLDYYKENQKLKSDLAFERTMLDNVRAEYDSLQNVIKKLKEEKQPPRFSDFGYDLDNNK